MIYSISLFPVVQHLKYVTRGVKRLLARVPSEGYVKAKNTKRRYNQGRCGRNIWLPPKPADFTHFFYNRHREHYCLSWCKYKHKEQLLETKAKCCRKNLVTSAWGTPYKLVILKNQIRAALDTAGLQVRGKRNPWSHQSEQKQVHDSIVSLKFDNIWWPAMFRRFSDLKCAVTVHKTFSNYC